MVAGIKNKFDLKNNFLHYYIEWYFRISTTTTKNVWQHCEDKKNQYAKKPYTCEFCNVTILKGNKWLHSKSYKHELNTREKSVKITENIHEVGKSD